MSKSARVIITTKCLRKCAGCCNTYENIMSHVKTIYDIKSVKDYDIVMLTGGEPMLMPERVIELSKQLREVSKCKIYLYTADYKNPEDLENVIQNIDGIQYSLHAEASLLDVSKFQTFQLWMDRHRHSKSFRLFIDNKLSWPVCIHPDVWKRVEVKPWLTEQELVNIQPNGLPEGEELFILK